MVLENKQDCSEYSTRDFGARLASYQYCKTLKFLFPIIPTASEYYAIREIRFSRILSVLQYIINIAKLSEL